MKAVTRSEIEAAWSCICDLDSAGSQELTRQFMQVQPALGIYIAAQQESLQEEGSEAPLVELCLAVWKAMSETAGHALPQADPEAIDAAESANEMELDRLEEGSEFDMQEKVNWLGNHYHQRELLRFALEVLMAPHEDQPDLAPETQGLELLCVKTVIDCLERPALA